MTASTRRSWPAKTILERIRAWNRKTGSPPSASDWNPALAIALGHPERAERYYADGTWPHAGTVQERFGSWNAAIREAGLRPRGIGEYDRTDPGFDRLCREIRKRYEVRGESTVSLAKAYGCAPSTIARRISLAGGTMRTPAEGRRRSS